MRNLKKYSNHNGYAVNESLGKIVSICKTENHVHYEGRPYTHKIEYLQSSGTQWIDTGIAPDENTHFKIDVVISNNGDVQFGCIHNQRFHMGKYSNTFHFGIGGNYLNTIAQDISRHILEIDSNGTGTIDGTAYSVGSGYTETTLSTYNIYLFARNTSNVAKCYVQGNLYSVQISQGGILVRDMYPVRVGTTGYMYDRVSKRLFGNAGTGEFVLGPDV